MPLSNFYIFRQTLPVVLCVGKSSDRQYTEQLKETILDIIGILREKITEFPECNIEIAYYLFDDYVVSISSLEAVDNFDESIFDNLNGKSTALNFTELLLKINNDFSRVKLFSNDVGCFAPIIVFILDGQIDYLFSGIEFIKNNKWYNNSIKAAVVYNDYSKNYDTILELIENCSERIITMNNLQLLKKLIEPISTADGRMPERALETPDLVDGLGIIDEKKQVNKVCTQVIAVPSNDKIHMSGIYNLKKCQVSICEPDKANDDIVIIEALHNGINVRNVSELTLYTARKVGSHDTRCFDYELGKKFLIDARKDAFVSFDFNQDGNIITIENMSDNDIDFVVELNEEPHFMQTDDVIFDFNGDVVLMVVDENDSAVTNINWSENYFNDGGWD